MLEGSLFESRDRSKTRKPLTVVLSVMAHVATVSVARSHPADPDTGVADTSHRSILIPAKDRKASSIPTFTVRPPVQR